MWVLPFGKLFHTEQVGCHFLIDLPKPFLCQLWSFHRERVQGAGSTPEQLVIPRTMTPYSYGLVWGRNLGAQPFSRTLADTLMKMFPPTNEIHNIR